MSQANATTQNAAAALATTTHLRPLVQAEVQSMLQKGAIEQVSAHAVCFVSALFLVPKKGGQWRPVVNLRPLNRFIQYEHFKMEGIHLVRDLLQEGDCLAKINLKDAYFTVAVAPHHRKYQLAQSMPTASTTLTVHVAATMQLVGQSASAAANSRASTNAMAPPQTPLRSDASAEHALTARTGDVRAQIR